MLRDRFLKGRSTGPRARELRVSCFRDWRGSANGRLILSLWLSIGRGPASQLDIISIDIVINHHRSSSYKTLHSSQHVQMKQQAARLHQHRDRYRNAPDKPDTLRTTSRAARRSTDDPNTETETATRGVGLEQTEKSRRKNRNPMVCFACVPRVRSSCTAHTHKAGLHSTDDSDGDPKRGEIQLVVRRTK